MGVSAVVLTRNSSNTIEKCLKSLLWCDEIIVIDDNSIDQTTQRAKKFGAKVFNQSLHNDFSQQRNFGLEKASNKWVFFIDSDEVVSSALAEEINEYTNIQINEHSGYLVKRIDYMWGKELKHGETGNMWLLRLAKKGAGKWKGIVHETWDIKGEKDKLKNSLNHFPHPSVSDFLVKINFYSTLRAEELYQQKITVRFLDIVTYPKAKFFVNYFLKLGFLDGIPGFLVATMMSFHSYLVRGKVWQLQNSHQ